MNQQQQYKIMRFTVTKVIENTDDIEMAVYDDNNPDIMNPNLNITNTNNVTDNSFIGSK